MIERRMLIVLEAIRDMDKEDIKRRLDKAKQSLIQGKES